MSPLQFLMLMMAITAIAGVIHAIRRQTHVRRLRRLAGERHLHFSAIDRFQLAPRIAPHLPVPGAAGVRIVDLVYGIDQGDYRYVFLTEFTSGVLRTKIGNRRVISMREPRDEKHVGQPGELVFAPESLPLLDQYEHLLKSDESSKERSGEATDARPPHRFT